MEDEDTKHALDISYFNESPARAGLVCLFHGVLSLEESQGVQQGLFRLGLKKPKHFGKRK